MTRSALATLGALILLAGRAPAPSTAEPKDRAECKAYARTFVRSRILSKSEPRPSGSTRGARAGRNTWPTVVRTVVASPAPHSHRWSRILR